MKIPIRGTQSVQDLTEAVAQTIYGDDNVELLRLNPVFSTWHQLVPTINFNSLNRIVTGFVSQAVESLQKENDALRALIAKHECIYGHRNVKGVCELGYPGCACMDDLVATMQWSPEDEGAAANKRLLDRAEAAEAELKKLKSTFPS